MKIRPKSSFLTDIVQLSLGTLLGRASTVIAFPLLTRLYSPEDFSILAIYLALVSTFSVVACLRLDLAIPIAETDKEAGALLVLSLLSVLVISILLSLSFLFSSEWLVALLGGPQISPYLWLVPLGVALSGSYSAFQYWATRARRFVEIARSRIGQSVLGVATMILFGWTGLAPLGLLVGNILVIGAGGISLSIGIFRWDRSTFTCLSLKKLVEIGYQNRKYTMFSSAEALINVAGQSISTLLIASNASAEAGHFFLAMQIASLPMVIFGSSVGQVYLSRAPTEFRNGTLASFTVAVMSKLALTSTGPLLLVGVLASSLFSVTFGPNWIRAGEVMLLLVPAILLQLIASPVSTAVYVVGKDRLMLSLTILGLAMRVGTVSLGITFFTWPPVVGFAIGSAVYYLTVLGFVLIAVGAQPKQWFSLFVTFCDWRVVAPTTLALIIWLIKLNQWIPT